VGNDVLDANVLDALVVVTRPMLPAVAAHRDAKPVAHVERLRIKWVDPQLGDRPADRADVSGRVRVLRKVGGLVVLEQRPRGAGVVRNIKRNDGHGGVGSDASGGIEGARLAGIDRDAGELHRRQSLVDRFETVSAVQTLEQALFCRRLRRGSRRPRGKLQLREGELRSLGEETPGASLVRGKIEPADLRTLVARGDEIVRMRQRPERANVEAVGDAR